MPKLLDVKITKVRPDNEPGSQGDFVRRALEAAPWVDMGGGWWAKTAVVAGKSYSCVEGACQGCQETDFLHFRLRDELWQEVCRNDQVLCLWCVVERLGRRLVAGDFYGDAGTNNRTFRFLLGV